VRKALSFSKKVENHIAIRHQLSTNIWERGHPACPNASETLTFPVHAQLSQDCYIGAIWYFIHHYHDHDHASLA
jgi:hypothetical protein